MFSKEYKSHFKQNFQIALPVSLSQLGHISVGVADTIMAGRLGGLPLASATIATSVFIPFLMLGIGFSYGATSLIAKADGEGDKESIAGMLKHSFYLNLILGVILSVGLYFSSPVLRMLNQPAEVVEAAIPFAEILALSLFPLMIFQSFKQFAEGLSFTKEAMFISISGNILNIFLINVFTYGWFGVASMGLNGIALATLLARFYYAFAMFLFVRLDKRFSFYWEKIKEVKSTFLKYKTLFVISFPIGIQMVIESGAFGFASIMVGWLGTGEIAAHQIAINMASVTYMAGSGIAAAATVRVGNEYGKKNYSGLRKAGFSAFYMVLIYMIFCAIMFILSRFYLPTLYINEPEIIRMASSLLLIAAFFQLSDGVQVVGLGALRGLGDVRIPTVVVIVAYWIVGLPLGYVLGFTFKLGIEGVWYGLLIGLTFVAIFLLFRFINKTKQLTSLTR